MATPADASPRPGVHGSSDPAPRTSATQRAAEGPEQPFTGRLQPLDRVGTVRPDTVVVVFPPAGEPVLRQPGQTLLPRWNPFRAPARILPVITAPIPLRVRVQGLLTFDGATIEHATVEVTVRLVEADEFGAARQLAVTYGPGFGLDLLTEVQSRIEAGVRAAFRMNGLDDLRRAGVEEALAERWLPVDFAAGTLRRHAVRLVEVAWPTADAQTRAGSRKAAGRSRVERISPAVDSTGSAVPLELSVEARLRRVWDRNCRSPLVGIAGAVVDGRACVVAVTPSPPPAYETSRLAEVLGEVLGSRAATLVVSSAEDYAELADQWLRQVDGRHVRLLGVDILRRGDVLRIRLDGPLARPGEVAPARPSATGCEAEALRRLLPFRSVELTAARPA